MSYMLIQIAFKRVDELKANYVWLDQENQHFRILKFASQLSFLTQACFRVARLSNLRVLNHSVHILFYQFFLEDF